MHQETVAQGWFLGVTSFFCFLHRGVRKLQVVRLCPSSYHSCKGASEKSEVLSLLLGLHIIRKLVSTTKPIKQKKAGVSLMGI